MKPLVGGRGGGRWTCLGLGQQWVGSCGYGKTPGSGHRLQPWLMTEGWGGVE